MKQYNSIMRCAIINVDTYKAGNTIHCVNNKEVSSNNRQSNIINIINIIGIILSNIGCLNHV